MVVAEVLGEGMSLVRERVHHRRPRGTHDRQVVPEVFHALAPLVQVLGGRLGASAAEVLPAAPVDPRQSARHRLEAITVERPAADASARRSEDLHDLRRRLGASAGGRAELVGLERLAEIARVRSRDLLVELLEGVEHDVGVAHAGELLTGVAEAGVLPSVDVVADLCAHQPDDRTQLLHVLARVVDRLLG